MDDCQVGNNLEYLDKSFNDILSKLLIESDNLWRCLKYNTSDALTQSITVEDKIALIKQEDLENRRVILGSYNDDIVEDERTELRIFVHGINARARYDFDIIYGFEIIVHNNLRALNGSKQRLNIMLHEIVKILNLEPIDNSIGKLLIEGHSVERVHFNKSFEGFFFTMNNYAS